MAVVFSMERLYVDSGYYLMRVVNHQSFWIEHHRMILLFPEWLPLLGVYLKLPLKVVILLYSIGHVLFFYIAYLVSRYGLGNEMAGYQLSLIQVLGLIHGFFVPVFELYYGCGLAIIFLSLLQKENLSNAHIIGGLLLLAFTLMSHPMMLFLVAAVLLYHILEQKKFRKIHVGMLVVMAAVFTFKSFVKSEYEAGKTQAFVNNLKNLSYTGEYLGDMLSFMLSRYPDVLLLLAVLVLMLFINKKRALGVILLLSFFGILMLCNINYRGFDTSRYAEQVYFPIGAILILFLPFITKATQAKKFCIVLTACLLLVFGYRISLILGEGKKFAERINAIKELCLSAQSLEGSKFIIPEAPFDSTFTPSANWSVTLESLFITGSQPDLKTVTICTDIDYQESINAGRVPSPEDYLFRRWEMYADSTLNPNYFHLLPSEYESLDKEKVLKPN